MREKNAHEVILFFVRERRKEIKKGKSQNAVKKKNYQNIE